MKGGRTTYATKLLIGQHDTQKLKIVIVSKNSYDEKGRQHIGRQW